VLLECLIREKCEKDQSYHQLHSAPSVINFSSQINFDRAKRARQEVSELHGKYCIEQEQMQPQ
jgi:hypothetical protein